MRSIIFISRCPGLKYSQEGMMQRIINIEAALSSDSITYLDLYIFKFFKLVTNKIDNKLVYRINILRFWKIYKILRGGNLIYIHSIYFLALGLIPLLFAKKNKQIVLDLHGVVPEELLFERKLFLSKIFSVIERIAFKIANNFIYVTNNMKEHFSKKYPHINRRELVYSIFTSNVCKFVEDSEISRLKNTHEIKSSDVVFIYSGGINGWQNIDLMFETIKKIADVEGYRFFILTLQVNEMMRYLNKYNLSNNTNIYLGTVMPSELGAYYSMAHYGFVLRDEHVLNRVANPTKLVEYLYYGLIPIVKSRDIGDFLALGFETVSFDNLSKNMKIIKSSVNSNIAKKLLINNELTDLSKSI